MRALPYCGYLVDLGFGFWQSVFVTDYGLVRWGGGRVVG